MNEPRVSPCCDYCGLPLPARLWKSKAPAESEGPCYCCIGCRIAASVVAGRADSEPSHALLTRLGLGLFFSMSVMVFTFALWSYDVYSPNATDPAALRFVELLRYLTLLFTLPVLVLLGGPLFESAVRDLRRGAPTTDLLLVTGVLAAVGYSTVSVIRGRGDVYFETACTILMFVMLGRWLEATGRSKASAVLDRLEQLIPETVHRLIDGLPSDVPVATVQPGDLIEVRPGERIPCDGLILAHATSVDEQLFTGESWPVAKGPGDEVLGGTLNIDGCIHVRVAAPPRQGTLRRMLDAVHEARQAKGAYELLADRVARWFFPIIAAIAVATFAVHAMLGNAAGGLLAALAVVLIACPCALAIATPFAVWVALGRAAEHQVLFRSGAALERLAQVQALCFDKTGTLTTGDVLVRKIAADPAVRRDDVMTRAAVLASHTDHPIGRAVAGVAEIVGIRPRVRNVTLSPGRGVIAHWNGEWRATLLGSHRYLVEEQQWTLPPQLASTVSEALADGSPLALIGWDGCVHGVFVFREELRAEASCVLQELQDQRFALTILTGDHRGRGRQLEKELNVPVLAALLPHEKSEHIAKLSNSGVCVAMVGDGVNDAAAIAAADVGIAMGCGADVTRNSADVCLLSNDLSQLVWSLGLARRTVRTIRQNLGWSFAYNGIGVLLAAVGWLHPSVAAVCMVASSLAVTANSLRLRRFGEVDQRTGTISVQGGPPPGDNPIPPPSPHQRPALQEADS